MDQIIIENIKCNNQFFMYVINFLVIELDLYICNILMLFLKINSSDVHESYRSEWLPDLVFGL